MKFSHAATEKIAMPAEYATRACGIKDTAAKFPEPEHFDCKGCHAILVALLSSRVPALPLARKPLQIPAPWMKDEQ